MLTDSVNMEHMKNAIDDFLNSTAFWKVSSIFWNLCNLIEFGSVWCWFIAVEVGVKYCKRKGDVFLAKSSTKVTSMHSFALFTVRFYYSASGGHKT